MIGKAGCFMFFKDGLPHTDSIDGCTLIDDYGVTYHTRNITSLLFGLIKYNCSGKTGVTISDPSCVSCQMYCPENDKIVGCQHTIFPIIASSIISLAVFMTLLFCIMKARPYIERKANQWKYGREMQRQMRIRKEVIYLQGKELLSNNAREVVIESNSDNENNIDDAEALEQYNDVANRRMSWASDYLPMAPLRPLAILSLLTLGLCCDETLFMTSDSKICTSNTCYDMMTYTFSLDYGSTVCFRTVDDGLMKFKLVDMHELYRYRAIYKTSDYKVQSEGYSNCKQSGKCDKEHCYDGAVGESFKNDTNSHYTCKHEGLGCDFMCYHKYACTWIRWWIDPVGKTATVYVKDYSIWHMRMAVELNKIVQVIELNANNPKSKISATIGGNIINIPIDVVALTKETKYTDGHILIDGYQIRHVDASSKNLPQKGRIGDLQIELSQNVHITQPDLAICSVAGCGVNCWVPQSALSRVRDTQVYTETELVESNKFFATTRTKIMGNVKLNLGNVNFKSLYLEQASCKIDAVSSFGCLGCKTNPFVILKAYDVMQPGLLQFTSNCTFNRNQVSCSDEPYKLELLDTNTACYIHIPITNQTIFMNITINFYDKLTIPTMHYGKSTDLDYFIRSVTQNPSFITGLYTSFLAYTGITVVSVIALRAISGLMAAYMAKRQMDVTLA